jgi:hypothetical protein
MADNRFLKYAQPQGVMVRGPDPMQPINVARGHADLAAAPLERESKAVGIQQTRQNIANTAAVQPFNARKAAADAAKAEADARAAQRSASGVSEANRAAARERVNNALTLRRQLQDAYKVWKGPMASKNPLEWVPGYGPREELLGIRDTMEGIGMKMLRTPGDPMAQVEAQRVLSALPDPNKLDDRAKGNFNQLDLLLKEIIRRDAPVAGLKVHERKPVPKGKQGGDVDSILRQYGVTK